MKIDDMMTRINLHFNGRTKFREENEELWVFSNKSKIGKSFVGVDKTTYNVYSWHGSSDKFYEFNMIK